MHVSQMIREKTKIVARFSSPLSGGATAAGANPYKTLLPYHHTLTRYRAFASITCTHHGNPRPPDRPTPVGCGVEE